MEGRQLVAAAEKNKRIVMHGTQYRSNGTLIRDMKLMHEGFIGEISHSRGYVYKNGNRNAIGFGKPGKPPETSIGNSGKGPLRITTIWLKKTAAASTSTTTGTGSGNMATARSAIRACTKWT